MSDHIQHIQSKLTMLVSALRLYHLQALNRGLAMSNLRVYSFQAGPFLFSFQHEVYYGAQELKVQGAILVAIKLKSKLQGFPLKLSTSRLKESSIPKVSLASK